MLLLQRGSLGPVRSGPGRRVSGGRELNPPALTPPRGAPAPRPQRRGAEGERGAAAEPEGEESERAICPRGAMGRLFKQYLNGHKIYSCSNCRCHTSDHDEIISKAFQGRHGRAYLFSNVVNITLGPKEDRLLITGLHTVSDIYCSCCQQVLGWKYLQAFEESQKYKEGKFIIEKAKMVKEGNWQ